MGYTQEMLDKVSEKIAAPEAPLKEARVRLALVRATANGFEGALRTYQSGSLAHHTVIDPVSDGDGGLVLDRVKHTTLGPEGKGESPSEIVSKICGLLGPELRKTYPNARCSTSKRGPKISFGQPVSLPNSREAQDPFVDLVVALTRREGSGLWIPNLEKNTWEASDPEKHAELISSGTVTLVAKRRRVIRLLKAWNKQFTKPAFSSFHLTVLAHEHVVAGQSEAEALRAVFTEMTKELERGDSTKDPAGVSQPLKLLESREIALVRARAARDRLNEALENDSDEEKVALALSRLYSQYISAPPGDVTSKAVSAIRRGGPIAASVVGLTTSRAVIPVARSYGEKIFFEE